MVDIVYGLRGPVKFRTFPTADTAIKKGFWCLASSGAAVVAAAADTSVASTTAILGVAQEATVDSTSGATKTSIVIAVAEPGVEFEMRLGITASTYVLPATHLGKSYEIKRVSTTSGLADAFYVDVTGDTNDHVRVVDFVPDDIPTWPAATTNASSTNGIANGRVWVQPLAATSFLSGARAAT